MFKNHPKGLIGAALSNMGERFGFYIMMAILTLFISSKFGLSETTTGYIYSAFYASIYLLALVGGIIADKTKNYKGTILTGLILMAVGYLIIAIPTPTPVPNMGLYLALTCGGLLVIAFGNGLFKGNLQALVGQMYDNPKYSDRRDSGFQIFYMFINIGGFFAPFIAIMVRNWWLKAHNFDYNASLPELCHQYVGEGSAMPAESLTRLTEYANAATLDGSAVTDLGAFVNQYLDVFNTGFQYAFGAAIVAMLISLVIFLVNKKTFPDPAQKKAPATEGSTITKEEVTMSIQEIKQRIYALFAVFGVVIFFWLSFHQNGYSLTYFARDYVDLSVINIDLGFVVIKGAEIFQSVNPFFVVTLTPLVMWLFGALKKRGKEPSTPMKIAIGMGIAAIAYIFLMVFSFALPAKETLSTMSAVELDAMKVTPWVMIGMYFILTVAELFISPLGLSFVSKVAPPHLQGLMQGCWLAATAIGNSILFIGGLLYTSVPIWACWLVFVIATGLSMLVMLSMVKWLERITNS
ncbi:POT family proton-dependent oligopeptide transporter [Parabacteroides sp. PFB2-12]|uniref:peptide MFS transporter n=1 Tax=unclassified Parabacteroides TaxID=2649774 RepID=UPI002476E2C8|nr:MULTISPECIES: peptide MFS transporter [unclassified Parabacteroides]MDH6342995.1 POT family proton-dependent oligopeptide transporter [Parabacteroides sp. PM6-13]MDH6390990.1 POT family proton-dependent oligopeptide transporter [Parabacteroides sp. PFB2-12]